MIERLIYAVPIVVSRSNFLGRLNKNQSLHHLLLWLLVEFRHCPPGNFSACHCVFIGICRSAALVLARCGSSRLGLARGSDSVSAVPLNVIPGVLIGDMSLFKRLSITLGIQGYSEASNMRTSWGAVCNTSWVNGVAMWSRA